MVGKSNKATGDMHPTATKQDQSTNNGGSVANDSSDPNAIIKNLKDKVAVYQNKYDQNFAFTGKTPVPQSICGVKGWDDPNDTSYCIEGVTVTATPGANIEQNKQQIKQFVDVLLKDGWALKQRVSKKYYRDSDIDITSSPQLVWDHNGYDVFASTKKLGNSTQCNVAVFYQIPDATSASTKTDLQYVVACQEHY